MKILFKTTFILMCLFQISADINGGDLKSHDLTIIVDLDSNKNETVVDTGCGEPPDGYFIWLDGDDPYAGSMPSPTASWTDKGRESRYFDQPNTDHQPTINGGYLSFDGNDDYLKAGNDSNWSELFSSSNYFCNHLVRNNNHSNLRQAIWGTYSTGATSRPNFNVITDLNGGQQEYYINQGLGTHFKVETAATEALGTWYNYKTEYDRTGLQARTGNDATWGSYTAAIGAAGTAPIQSYYTYNIGGVSSGLSYGTDTAAIWEWAGDIAQIICYTDLTKEAVVETWINCKKSELIDSEGGG